MRARGPRSSERSAPGGPAPPVRGQPESPSPRLRGEGRGEGPLFELGQQRLENSVEILDNIVVPDADHAITEGAKCTITAPVFGIVRVLATVKFDDQTPLAANKVGVVARDRLLPASGSAAAIAHAR